MGISTNPGIVCRLCEQAGVGVGRLLADTEDFIAIMQRVGRALTKGARQLSTVSTNASSDAKCLEASDANSLTMSRTLPFHGNYCLPHIAIYVDVNRSRVTVPAAAHSSASHFVTTCK